MASPKKEAMALLVRLAEGEYHQSITTRAWALRSSTSTDTPRPLVRITRNVTASATHASTQEMSTLHGGKRPRLK